MSNTFPSSCVMTQIQGKVNDYETEEYLVGSKGMVRTIEM